MSGDVVYTDVTFNKKGDGKVPASSDQENVTYSEVRKGSSNPTETSPEEATYSEVKRDSQQKSSPAKSNIKKRVVIGILIIVLLLAAIGIVIFLIFKCKFMNTCEVKAQPPTTTPVPPCVTPCEADWDFNGTKCYNFSTNKSSWEDSRDTCRSLNGNLVKIESRKELTFVFDKLSPSDFFWIGLTDSENERSFKWTDGSALDPRLTFWKTDPDDYKDETHPEGEDCVVILRDNNIADRSWADIFCDLRKRFICEKEPNCKP